jgi:hypothetical protein
MMRAVVYRRGWLEKGCRLCWMWKSESGWRWREQSPRRYERVEKGWSMKRGGMKEEGARGVS